jgi:hypothetical protein
MVAGFRSTRNLPRSEIDMYDNLYPVCGHEPVALVEGELHKLTKPLGVFLDETGLMELLRPSFVVAPRILHCGPCISSVR